MKNKPPNANVSPPLHGHKPDRGGEGKELVMAERMVLLKLLALLAKILGREGAELLLREQLTEYEIEALSEIVTAYQHN